MEFKDILFKLRKENGLSQKKLADQLKVSQASVNYWEKGERTPSITVLENIANFFHVSGDYLMGWEEKREKYKEDSEPTTMAAHFDGTEFSEEQLKRIREFAEFIKMQDSKKEPASHLQVKAAHERTDIEVTDEMRKHDDDIMNDPRNWD